MAKTKSLRIGPLTEVSSPSKEKLADVIEAYKIKNPVKAEKKKAELERKLNNL